MKSRMLLALAACALVVCGLSVSTEAQTRYRTNNGGSVTYRPNGRRIYRSPNGRRVIVSPPRNNWHSARRWRNNNWRSNRRSAYRNWGGRTYRTPYGRNVTILPNGRRIYS